MRNAFTGITLDLLSNITYTLTPNDGSFAYFSFWRSGLGVTELSATAEEITVSNGTADVPGPATLSLLGLGLGLAGLAGLAASRRKRAQR